MLRTALARASRAITATAPRVSQLPVRRTIQSPFASLNASNPITRLTAIRCYASGSGLNQEEVTGRILDLLKNFDKVSDPSKLSSTAHFTTDLGLDSLDTVEVVMAIEEEFSIEIPDKEADAIHSVGEAVTYIMKQPDAN